MQLHSWHFNSILHPDQPESSSPRRAGIRLFVIGVCDRCGLVRFNGAGEGFEAIVSSRPSDARVDLSGDCPGQPGRSTSAG